MATREAAEGADGQSANLLATTREAGRATMRGAPGRPRYEAEAVEDTALTSTKQDIPGVPLRSRQRRDP